MRSIKQLFYLIIALAVWSSCSKSPSSGMQDEIIVKLHRVDIRGHQPNEPSYEIDMEKFPHFLPGTECIPNMGGTAYFTFSIENGTLDTLRLREPLPCDAEYYDYGQKFMTYWETQLGDDLYLGTDSFVWYFTEVDTFPQLYPVSSEEFSSGRPLSIPPQTTLDSFVVSTKIFMRGESLQSFYEAIQGIIEKEGSIRLAFPHQASTVLKNDVRADSLIWYFWFNGKVVDLTDTARMNQFLLVMPPPLPLDTCHVALQLDVHLSTIVKHPRQFMNMDDYCIYMMIDSLSTKAVRTQEELYLVALDSIYLLSDSYTKRYIFPAILRGQFFDNFGGLMAYFSQQPEGASDSNRLRNAVLQALVKLAEGKGLEKQKEIDEFMDVAQQQSNYTTEEMKTIRLFKAAFKQAVSEDI